MPFTHTLSESLKGCRRRLQMRRPPPFERFKKIKSRAGGREEGIRISQNCGFKECDYLWLWLLCCADNILSTKFSYLQSWNVLENFGGELYQTIVGNNITYASYLVKISRNKGTLQCALYAHSRDLRFSVKLGSYLSTYLHYKVVKKINCKKSIDRSNTFCCVPFYGIWLVRFDRTSIPPSYLLFICYSYYNLLLYWCA